MFNYIKSSLEAIFPPHRVSTWVENYFDQTKLIKVIIPKNEQCPDNVDVYDGINWEKTTVGGSTALKQFTKDDKINPSDLDYL